MKTTLNIFLLTCFIFLNACSSSALFTKDIRHDNVGFDSAQRKTIISAIDKETTSKIEKLKNMIMRLGPKINHTEAAFVAREAVIFPKHLANQYKLVSPAASQNILVNSGKRKKGLCYHFAKDMLDHLVKGRVYNTLTLKRSVSSQGKPLEHHVLTVAAKGRPLEEAIILDAWRNSASLYFVNTQKDPKYQWEKYTPRYASASPKKPPRVPWSQSSARRIIVSNQP